MKTKRILSKILIVFLTIIVFMIPHIMAVSINPDQYNPNTSRGGTDTSKILEIGGEIWSIFSTVAVVVAVVALAILGLKYMVGSLEEKAQYKKAMIPYVVGLFLVVGIQGINMMIYDFSNGTVSASTRCSNCNTKLDSATEKARGMCGTCWEQNN